MKRIPRIIAAFATKSGRGRDLMRGVAAFAMQHGRWHCEFTTTDPTENTLRHAAEVDGLLIQIVDEKMATGAAKLRIPIVVLGNYNPLAVPQVSTDQAAIGEIAARHLIEQGFRRFVYYAHHGTPGSQLLGEAFVEALKRLGHGCDWFQLEKWSQGSWQPDHAPMVAWVKRLKKPTAVFTMGDAIARDIAVACRDARIRVPGQLAILGNNNDVVVCKMCRPHLSSVESDSARVGFEAARLLQRMLDGRKVPAKPVLLQPLRVIARESTELVTARDPLVTATLGYMREHLAEGVNVKELTRQMRISRPTLNRAFVAQFGRKVHAEIVRMQLQKACQLLEQHHLPLAQVAEECGMHYKTRLANFFKKHMKMTPLEYRQSFQQNDF